MTQDQIAKARQIAEQRVWHAFSVQMEQLAQNSMAAALRSETQACAEWRNAVAPLYQELKLQLLAVQAASEAA